MKRCGYSRQTQLAWISLERRFSLSKRRECDVANVRNQQRCGKVTNTKARRSQRNYAKFIWQVKYLHTSEATTCFTDIVVHLKQIKPDRLEAISNVRANAHHRAIDASLWTLCGGAVTAESRAQFELSRQVHITLMTKRRQIVSFANLRRTLRVCATRKLLPFCSLKQVATPSWTIGNLTKAKQQIARISQKKRECE